MPNSNQTMSDQNMSGRTMSFSAMTIGLFLAMGIAIISGCGGGGDASVVGSDEQIEAYLDENPDARDVDLNIDVDG